MAKKTSKKPAAKKKKSTAKKTAGKPAKRGSTKVGGGSDGPGMFEVDTGSGACPAEIGADLVAMFNRGKFHEIEAKYWSPNIESVEGVGVGLGWRGRAAVEAKNAEWMSQNTLRGASAEGPFVGSSGFAVKFRMDVEDKASLKRTVMDEVGIYTVRNGKIIREEFMYGGKTEQSSQASK